MKPDLGSGTKPGASQRNQSFGSSGGAAASRSIAVVERLLTLLIAILWVRAQFAMTITMPHQFPTG
jgi:hypothetical protein